MKINTQENLNESTPDSPMIPSRKKKAEKYRKAFDKWNKEVNKNRGKDLSKLHYWEKASICATL